LFLLKALEGVLHQWWKLSLTELVFDETSTQTYSLSAEGFGYNCGRLKSSASHASRENTLLRCGKNPKWVRRLQRHWWARLTGSGLEASMLQARACGTVYRCTCDETWTLRVSSVNWKHFYLGVSQPQRIV